jgi:hypothetical protein
MNTFQFDSKIKRTLIGFMIVGALCLLLTFLTDHSYGHARFWSNFLHNTVFFTGIAFVSLFILTAFTTAYAGWHTQIKRIWEAYSLFLIPGLVLFLLIIAGIWGHFHHLYHWADPEAVAEDRLLQGKAPFLNKYWYTFGTLGIVGVWIFFALKLRQLSLREDEQGDAEYRQHFRSRVWSAIFLPIAAFSSAAVIWLWTMSVDAHWYSTLYAWYTTASWFVAAMCLTILTVIFLKSLGHLEAVTSNHLHDLGKYVFAFSIFWTYLWFSQYMLIWYANVGEETIYFRERLDNYPVLFYGNLVLNFLLPFFVFMRNDTKRKYGTLVFVAIMVFFGHWWDFFLMIKPGVWHTAHEAAAHHAAEAAHHGASSFVAGFTIPGLLELGTMLGFVAGFAYFAFSQMAKASLVPQNDPFLEESMHHQVWPYE